MHRSRLSTALYLLLVFTSGILVGVVGYRLYVTTTVTAKEQPAPKTMEQYRKLLFSDLRQKVGVNDRQIAEINHVLDVNKQKFDELHAQEKPFREKLDQERIEGIRAVLTDSQKTAYDNWRAERARQHAEDQKKKLQQQTK